ncbi:hypothetical protein EVAR_49200_1 [Eumeta japonica]|uniref:Uncharacterized protein n=1 Tax=Eumeta variegata TaxID=151549 RepID=A0A4C1XRU4_EUMVA|nr:hypothetical protein EVAR_49200_1 [Eumeta japonica]
MKEAEQKDDVNRHPCLREGKTKRKKRNVWFLGYNVQVTRTLVVSSGAPPRAAPGLSIGPVLNQYGPDHTRPRDTIYCVTASYSKLARRKRSSFVGRHRRSSLSASLACSANCERTIDC